MLLAVYVVIVSFATLSVVLSVALLSKTVWKLLLSIFIGFSFVTLKLLYFESFAQLADVWQLVVIAIIAVLVFFGINVRHGPSFVVFMFGFLIFVAGPISLNHSVLTASLAGQGSSEQESYFLNQLSGIKFKTSPNIYYLSYDSLVPTQSVKKFLGIDYLGYDNLLRDSFHVLTPSAAIFVPTKPSLNAMMRLDQESLNDTHNYFNGEKRSVISEILSNNGYEITTGYPSYYFGKKGPYVDRYLVVEKVPLEKTVLCISGSESFLKKMRNFGACEVVGRYSEVTEFIYSIFKRNDSTSSSIGWIESLNREITKAANRSSPQFIAVHTYNPIGHTRQGYRHSNLKQRNDFRSFFKSQDKLLTKILKAQIALIERIDPGSIVIVTGDHGLWVSRGIEKKNDSDFFIEDRHIIYTAVKTSQHHCSQLDALSEFSNDFFTPGRVLASIFSCLSGEKNLERILRFSDSSEISRVVESL